MKAGQYYNSLLGSVLFILASINTTMGQQLTFKVPAGTTVEQVSVQQYTATGPRPIASLAPAKEGFSLSTTSLSAGIYELIPDNLGRILFVYNGQSTLQFAPSEAQIKQHDILLINEEQKALSQFMGYYEQYRRYYTTAEDTLRAHWSRLGPKLAVDKFVHTYALNRKGLGIRVDSLIAKYPTSLTAQTVATMFKPILPQSAEEDLLELFHATFFNQYNFAHNAIFNNPFFYEELKTYFMFFATQKGELYNSIDILLSHQALATHSVNKEKMIEVLAQLLLEMQHPKAEEYIVYMDNNYAASCAGESGEKKVSLATRIKHTQPGATLPPFIFKRWQENSTVETATLVRQKPYTLLYFWMSTCEHCKITAPLVEQFTEQFQEQMNTVAIALDENEEALAGYLKYSKEIEKRQRPTNWVECWEPSGFKSNQLNQLYIKGTPFFILLDSQGKIVEKSNNLEVIQKKISEAITSVVKNKS